MKPSETGAAHETRRSRLEPSRLAAYFTLGCKLNFAETSTIGQQLKALGIQTATQGQVADICIINTCSVTQVADSKCRQAIRQMVRQHPGAVVIVTGCYAQLKPQDIANIPGVDLVIGNNEKGDIISKVQQLLNMMPQERQLLQHIHHTQRTADIRRFMPSCSCGNRTRYFLKVQDGCDYYCTYCTIPIARGRSRNGSIASMVQQATNAANQGAKEIVITGVNIGDFGRTTGETLLDLLQALDQVQGIQRYRISSIEPNLLTPDIIRFCAQSRAFMPHFHIPLQSGSDQVLQLMHRRYDTAFFRAKIQDVLQCIPDAFIGVDTIVGTRGETQQLFDQAYQFMASLPVAQYHVFSYSERPGTKALNIPHVVTPQDKHQRSQRILQLSDQLTQSYYKRYIGQTRPVLFEHTTTPGILSGHTDNYLKVQITIDPQIQDKLSNQILPVHLTSLSPDGMTILGTL